MEQRFDGVRLIVFNEIGVKQVNFWIALCDHNAFITHFMLMPVSDDMDLFLSSWTTKGYFRRNKTVCKYSQMLFLSWNVWN